MRLHPVQAEETQSVEGQERSSSSTTSTSTSSFPDVEKGKEGTYASLQSAVASPLPSSPTSDSVRRSRLLVILLAVVLFLFFFAIYTLPFYLSSISFNQAYIRSIAPVPFPLSSSSSSHLLPSPLTGFPVLISTSTLSSSFAPVFTECLNSACTRSRSEVLFTGGNQSQVESGELMIENRGGCGRMKYTMEVNSEGKAWVMRAGSKKGMSEIQVLLYDPQASGKSSKVQSFLLASSPSPSSPSNASVLFYPHSVHLNSDDEPVFIYSRVSHDDGMKNGEKEHRVILATCGKKDCGEEKIQRVEVVIRKRGEGEVMPILSSAKDKKSGQIFLAVASSRSSDRFSIFCCSSSSCSLSLTGGSLLSSSSSQVELHSLQIRVEASTSSPVVLYSTTREGGNEEEEYTIGLIRDGRDEAIVERKGDLHSLSFVLDPETEFPILLASATLSDNDDEHHTILRSCSSLYCDQDDMHVWMITLPESVGGVSGLEIAEKATNGPLMLVGKVRGEPEETGHVIIRLDILRHFDRHLVEEESDDEIVIG